MVFWAPFVRLQQMNVLLVFGPIQRQTQPTVFGDFLSRIPSGIGTERPQITKSTVCQLRENFVSKQMWPEILAGLLTR